MIGFSGKTALTDIKETRPLIIFLFFFLGSWATKWKPVDARYPLFDFNNSFDFNNNFLSSESRATKWCFYVRKEISHTGIDLC